MYKIGGSNLTVARWILLLAVLCLISLPNHLGYLLTKANGSGIHFLFMGFGKPFMLGLLLVALVVNFPTALGRVRWAYVFSAVPIFMIGVQIFHMLTLGDSNLFSIQILKDMLYVKIISSGISLWLIFLIFEIGIVVRAFDGVFLWRVSLVLGLCVIIAFILKGLGPDVAGPLFYATSWNNHLAYEASFGTWFLLKYWRIFTKSNSSILIMTLLLGSAGIIFTSRGGDSHAHDFACMATRS